MCRGDQTFPRSARLQKGEPFSRVFDQGRRFGDRNLQLLVLRRDPAAPATRLGVAVSRRCRTAVRRNRLKRLCREAFRLSRAELPAGLDVVMLPRIERDVTLADLRASLVKLLSQYAIDTEKGDD